MGGREEGKEGRREEGREGEKKDRLLVTLIVFPKVYLRIIIFIDSAFTTES